MLILSGYCTTLNSYFPFFILEAGPSGIPARANCVDRTGAGPSNNARANPAPWDNTPAPVAQRNNATFDIPNGVIFIHNFVDLSKYCTT